jgi:arsenate reductase
MEEKPRILILCVGNAARSQMAEAFLKKYAGDRFEIYSAGFEPQDIHPLTRQVMAEVGLDLKGQYAKGVKDFLGVMDFRYLIIVCQKTEERCPRIFPGVLQRLYWPFEDPVAYQGPEEEKLAKFRQVRDEIEARIRLWLKELD